MPALKAIISATASPFIQELNSAGLFARAWSNNIKRNVAGAVTGAVSFGTVKSVLEYADKVQVLSSRLGISTDAVQKWDYALRLSNSSVDAATGFFEKLATARRNALQGDTKMVDSFARLGIALGDLKKMRVEDIATQIARAFQAGDPQKLIADLREVGGRGAGELVAAFRDGLADAADEAAKSGAVIGEAVINQLAKAANDSKAVWMQFVGQAAPAIGYLADLFKRAWHDANVVANIAVGAVTNPRDPLALAREYDDEYKAAEKARAEAEARRKANPLVGGADDVKDAKSAEQQAKAVLRLKEELFRLQQENDLKSLDKEEQVQELYRRRAALIEAMKKGGEAERLKAAIGVEKIDADLRQIKDSDSGKPTTIRGNLTALQKVGAYAPAASVSILDVNKRMERHLARIDASLARRSVDQTQPRF